jgi:hypothetical protein
VARQERSVENDPATNLTSPEAVADRDLVRLVAGTSLRLCLGATRPMSGVVHALIPPCGASANAAAKHFCRGRCWRASAGQGEGTRLLALSYTIASHCFAIQLLFGVSLGLLFVCDAFRARQAAYRIVGAA